MVAKKKGTAAYTPTKKGSKIKAKSSRTVRPKNKRQASSSSQSESSIEDWRLVPEEDYKNYINTLDDDDIDAVHPIVKRKNVKGSA